MKNLKFIAILTTAVILLTAQAGAAFAAPSLQEPADNTVTALECGIDGTTVLVTYDDEDPNTPEVVVEISLETAMALGFLPEGTEICDESTEFEGSGEPIDPALLVPVEGEEEPQHPVGAALSEYFSDLGVDYDTIMTTHGDGVGFGVLAQALWLTTKMEGDSDTFLAIVQAKKDKDFSDFVLADESTPTNWGQFKKAVLDGDKKGNLGVVMSGKNKDKDNNGNGQDKDKSNNGKGDENGNKNKDKDKKDK
ncbi:MAG TPA: hypothetical protein VLA72_10500 [Anaerolineales bacterium]|nr:hypothetical protein [Anaerolineales bacterium]